MTWNATQGDARGPPFFFHGTTRRWPARATAIFTPDRSILACSSRIVPSRFSAG